MRTAYLFIALIFSCFITAQQPPNVLANYPYETSVVLTEDGEEFITWIVEDKQAEALVKELKSLPIIDVDRSEKHLVFTLRADNQYEYLFSRNKRTNRMYFRRVTIYSIVE
tara:strand:+ start:164 stop:496 length:333 start_codon:yes stop_codon:yes gene_type:complete